MPDWLIFALLATIAATAALTWLLWRTNNPQRTAARGGGGSAYGPDSRDSKHDGGDSDGGGGE